MIQPKKTFYLWTTIDICLTIIFLSLLFLIYQNIRTPFISVVLPTYNRADTFLPKAIESVLNQTFTNFELVIVDDGSTDKTGGVVRYYMNRDGRVKYVAYPKNKGVSHARNIGNLVARGTYIAVMDSDDLVYPDWLESAYADIKQHPDTTIFVPLRESYFDRTDTKALQKKFAWNYPLSDQFFYSAFGNVGMLFRRDFVQQHAIRYDDNLINGEDWDFWLKMGLAGASVKRIVSPKPLLLARIHWSNPQAYYDQAKQDADIIKKRFYRLLDIPTDKQDNRCFILQTAIQKIPRFLSQPDWQRGLRTYCPPQAKKTGVTDTATPKN